MAELYKVNITKDAKSDILDISNYLAQERGFDFANAFNEKLVAQIETLEQFPQRCPLVQGLFELGREEFRQLIISPYLIIYQIIEKSVLIMLVADGRRDMQSLLELRILR